jgi:hypothetical protein
MLLPVNGNFVSFCAVPRMFTHFSCWEFRDLVLVVVLAGGGEDRIVYLVTIFLEFLGQLLVSSASVSLVDDLLSHVFVIEGDAALT